MLRKYTDQDFKYLQRWVTDAELLLLFSGPEWTFPLTEEQIKNHREKYPFKQLYVGCDAENVPYAIGELIWNEENSPRLGRLLIGDPGQRGKGLGTLFVRELIDECVEKLDPESVCLFVFERNQGAIHCYRKVGFEMDRTEEPRKISLNGKQYMMLKMILHLK